MVKQESIVVQEMSKLRCLELPEITTSLTGKNRALKKAWSQAVMNISVGERDGRRRRLSRCRESKGSWSGKRGTACLGVIRARSCSGVTFLRHCLTSRSEAGLPRRRVPFQSSWGPMSEKIERNLPIYESTVEEAKRKGHWHEKILHCPRCRYQSYDLGFFPWSPWIQENGKYPGVWHLKEFSGQVGRRENLQGQPEEIVSALSREAWWLEKINARVNG